MMNSVTKNMIEIMKGLFIECLRTTVIYALHFYSEARGHRKEELCLTVTRDGNGGVRSVVAHERF